MKKTGKKTKNITTSDLAAMVQNGFTEIHSKMENGFTDLRGEMEKGFVEVNKRLDHIDDHFLPNHERRIEKLEDNMLLVKRKIGIK